MRLIFISDTHGNHKNLIVPNGDVLIHCGDFTKKSNTSNVAEFLNWFDQQNGKYKILVAGNHDRFPARKKEEFLSMISMFDVIYLEHNSTLLEGVVFFGSPYIPMFAVTDSFAYQPEDENKIWENIPKKMDVLITHGPPKGFCDFSLEQETHAGSQVLHDKVCQIKPKVHAFGHIHEAYGTTISGETVFINASVVNRAEELANLPVTFEL